MSFAASPYHELRPVLISVAQVLYRRQMGHDERRREPRYPCTGFAHIVDPTGAELGHGEVSDISASGASVLLYCPLKPGTIIEVRQGEHVYRGQIRYCNPEGADFRIGVQLIPPEQWSAGAKWPKLRTDSKEA
jgi:hypothetical protein